ncbi:1664_t:CDS:2, partial [Funneliformis geosporum]
MDENNEICEIIPSQKEKIKINVRGYLMAQEKKLKDTYYWFCEKKSLKISSNAIVAEIIGQIKQKARIIRDKSSQIIQDITSSMLQEYQPYMPSSNAL